MKIVQINCVCGIGSTGRIVMDLHHVMKGEGIESKVIYGYGQKEIKDTYRMQNMMELKYNILRGRITGRHGYYNKNATKKMLGWLTNFDPDIVHLHNIHGYYINVPVLIEYIKKQNKPVVWTLHDCWSFTGHCAYFDIYHCDKWKNGCDRCEAWKEYKILLRDRSEKNWKEKKELFKGIKNMRIITPSKWLADLVKQSFLAEYPIDVIHNGIDINKFTAIESGLRQQLNLENQKIVLGISQDLDGTKGGRYLLKLAKILGKHYTIVIVSLKTKEILPDNVIVLPKTNNIKYLAEIYSMADVLVNPTLQDNYPTINLEAAACGTPVITFNTGGSPEGIMPQYGEIVERENIQKLAEAVRKWTSINKKNINRIWNIYDLSKERFAKQYIDIYNNFFKGE